MKPEQGQDCCDELHETDGREDDGREPDNKGRDWGNHGKSDRIHEEEE